MQSRRRTMYKKPMCVWIREQLKAVHASAVDEQ
jgi:hypothetical protein